MAGPAGKAPHTPLAYEKLSAQSVTREPQHETQLEREGTRLDESFQEVDAEYQQLWM